MITKRQALLKYGFNERTFRALMAEKIIQPCRITAGKRPTFFFSSSDLDSSLVQGEHYVVCKECGAYQNQITSKHLNSCCSGNLEDYKKKFPDESILSNFTALRKAKTEEQKKVQSKKLKKRFQTPEGGETRKRISDSAKALMQTEYREIAIAHLTKLNQSDKYRKIRRKQAQERWASGELRKIVEQWHAEHREESLEGAKNARRFIQRKRTKLHLGFKEKMEKEGFGNFQTEHEVGYYSIDEADPRLKIAVEINGCYWHSCPKCGLKGPKNTLHTDKSKSTYLCNRGWDILVLWEHDIHKDPVGCIQKIKKLVEQREHQEVVC